jgi:hypothetical protein
LRSIGLAAAVAWASACEPGIDTTRQAPPPRTLGDDIFSALCDRVGAGALTEDLTGASFYAVCHADSAGAYASRVDPSGLPPVSGEVATKARHDAIAKVEAMARYRASLIDAFNTIFPDVEIDDVTTEATTDKIRLHDALWSLAQRLTPLYETNPYDADAEALVPEATRSLGRLFRALGSSDDAQLALAKLGGRKGYRPFNVALGAVRPALSYPKLRELAQAELAVLGPDGKAAPELQQLLAVVEHELTTSKAVVAPLPPYVVDANLAQPSRPRSTIEFTAALLLDQDAVFAEDAGEPARFIALRDKRGFAVPFGSVPGLSSTIAAPFVDLNGDGFADVDTLGRFLDGSKQPLAIDPPFLLADAKPLGSLDLYGRPSAGLYEYVDTSRTLTRALAKSFAPLLDATQVSAVDGPEAWRSEHETLIYALTGAYALFGEREKAKYDGAVEAIRSTAEDCATCVRYERFRGEDSPLADLLHALGQVLADADSDVLLVSLIDMLENHEPAVARLTGALLRTKEIADEHDALAAQGVEPLAIMPYETPVWEEMGEVIGRMTANPGLVARLLGALGSDDLMTPHGTSAHMGETVATLLQMRDQLTYDRWGGQAPNGLAVNVTDGAPSTADMHNPVDRTKPLAGDNRSCLQRSLQIIHDANGVKACNKDGATVEAKLGPIALSWPIWPAKPYKECELFTFDNLAAVYIDTMLEVDHPKRTELKLDDDTLNGLMSALSALGQDPDKMFEESSGIQGLTGRPSPPAMNRLVFFGANSEKYGKLSDYDPLNEGSQTAKFITHALEPIASAVCTKKSNGVAQCDEPSDLFRLRDANTIFLWERLGFYEYLRPFVTAFASVACSADLSTCETKNMTGEQLFIDVVEVLHRHWSGKDHGPECTPIGSAKTNPRYCSEAGISTYEPIVADALREDLLPALSVFAKTATELSGVTVQRGPHAGETVTTAAVLEQLTRILFDVDYAKQVKMVDRRGVPVATRVDGALRPQLTAFHLFADALHKFDLRFDATDDGRVRKGPWRRARSQLVDQFLAVEGKGEEARFKNRATPKMLLALLRTLREQLNAHCPERESGVSCTWAKTELGAKFATTLSGPVFAAIVDLVEKLRQDPAARRELERFVVHLLTQGSEGESLQATLASMNDLLQVLADDSTMSPIFNAISSLASPARSEQGPGATDVILKVLKALTSDDYDRYHLVDTLLPALVTPMKDGTGPAPIEVFLDAIADVGREDASVSAPLAPSDHGLVMRAVDELLTSKTRGMEQLYFIVQNRKRD